ERPCPPRQRTRDPRGARVGDDRQELADRSAAADADEQSRSRSRRKARGARGLWRHRPRGPGLGRLRPHRRSASPARGRRNVAGAVRQAGRRVPHPPRRAAGADRQLEPGAALGDLGALPRARSQGAHDVRPDDGRVVDLHRHAGDRSGHLRDLRRGRAPALRRRPFRALDPDRRPRRHGRGPAAGGGDGRRLDPGGGMPALPDREAARDPLPRRGGRGPRRGAGDHRARRPRAEAGQRRPARQRRRRVPRAGAPRRAAGHR
ncbi:MAG: Urocanate hydratase, partial [uncultured Microvirga sp.]